MATKDISDAQVCRAFVEAGIRRKCGEDSWPDAILQVETGQCEKVVNAAMARASRRGLVEYGVSLRSGWPTVTGWNAAAT